MLTLSLHGDAPGRLLFSPNGTLLVVAGSAMQVFDLTAGRRLWGKTPADPNFDGEVSFSADGRVLVLTTVAFGSHGFDGRTGQPTPVAPVGPYPGRRLRSGCGRWAIDSNSFPLHLHDLHGGRSIKLFRVTVRRPQARTADIEVDYLLPKAFSPDGELLVFSQQSRLVVLRTADLAAPAVANRASDLRPQPRTPRLEAVFRQLNRPLPKAVPPPMPAEVPAVAVLGGRQTVWDAVFTPDGRRLLVVRYDGRVTTWDAARWVEGAGYDFPVGPLTSVAVSPDGLLAAACGARKIVVWDLD